MRKLVDKLDQEILPGMYVIKPWDKSFVIGKVISVSPEKQTFKYTYKWYNKTTESVCKIPDRCLVVPEIVANYWSILE